jgi:NADH:ubiquinone oxidoreductase subunit 2 (subunit N)
MYMREPASETAPRRHGRLMWAGLATATVLTILLGVFPGLLLDVVGQAAQDLEAAQFLQGALR